MDRRRHHLFKFLMSDRPTLRQFALGGASKKVPARLPVKASHAVNPTQQIIGEGDLDLGHVLIVGRGFG
jgi:hypothetical protein